MQPSQSNIKVKIVQDLFKTVWLYKQHIIRTSFPNVEKQQVVINGAAKEIGRAAVIAVTKARGMEVAGAVDSYLVGEDIGKVLSSSFLSCLLHAFSPLLPTELSMK